MLLEGRNGLHWVLSGRSPGSVVPALLEALEGRHLPDALGGMILVTNNHWGHPTHLFLWLVCLHFQQ
jgi:hypothetical protein